MRDVLERVGRRKYEGEFPVFATVRRDVIQIHQGAKEQHQQKYEDLFGNFRFCN